MPLSIFEYILLRLARRFLFSNRFLERFGSLIPYYPRNCNLYSPRFVIDKYQTSVEKNGFTLIGKTALELGPGATNSTAYELAARGCNYVYAYEPFAHFNNTADCNLLKDICCRYGVEPETIVSRVKRVRSGAEIMPDSVHFVFSHSVLEHVSKPDQLIKMAGSKLTNDGAMVHIVDYRDHFFKYPYHMLLFSKKIWRKWLDPGDLQGWRLRDHISVFEQAGFTVAVDNIIRDEVNYSKIKKYISSDYDRQDMLLNVTQCTLVAHKLTKELKCL